MRQIAVIALTCLALAACAEGRQRSLESRKLDSGVTGDNGGGQSVLHNNPNVGVGSTGVTETGTRNKTRSRNDAAQRPTGTDRLRMRSVAGFVRFPVPGWLSYRVDSSPD